MKIETFFTWLCVFVITIIFIVIILVMFGLSINKLGSIPEEYCEGQGGNWIFGDEHYAYEGWCEFPDGTIKTGEEIWRLFNSTV